MDEKQIQELIDSVKSELTEELNKTVSNLQKKHGEWGDEVGKLRKDFDEKVDALKSEGAFSEDNLQKISEKLLDDLKEKGVISKVNDEGGSKGSGGTPTVEAVEQELASLSDEELEKMNEVFDSMDDEEAEAVKNDPAALLVAIQGVRQPGSTSLFDRATKKSRSSEKKDESAAIRAAQKAFRGYGKTVANEREHAGRRGKAPRKTEDRKPPKGSIPPSAR